MLVMPHLKTGINFGLTTMLHGILNCMDRGKVTPSTRTYIHCTDGGSENPANLMHAMNYVLVHYGVFDTVVWCRLPPNHSHDFVDRVFSAIETWLADMSWNGAFSLWELRDYLYQRFAHERSAYSNVNVAIDILLANYDFSQWFDGCVDESHLVIKEVVVVVVGLLGLCRSRQSRAWDSLVCLDFGGAGEHPSCVVSPFVPVPLAAGPSLHLVHPLVLMRHSPTGVLL